MSTRRHDTRRPVAMSRGERAAVRHTRRLQAASASSQAFWKGDVPQALRQRRYNAQPMISGLLRRNQFQARFAEAIMLCTGHAVQHGCKTCGPHGRRRILQTLDRGFGNPSVGHIETWTVVHVAFRDAGHQLSWREITDLHCHGMLYEINPDYVPADEGRDKPSRGPKYIAYYLRHWDYPKRQMVYQADRRPRGSSGSVRSSPDTGYSDRTDRSGTLQLGSEDGLGHSARRDRAIKDAAHRMAEQRMSRSRATSQAWIREVTRCLKELREIEIPKHRAAKQVSESGYGSRSTSSRSSAPRPPAGPTNPVNFPPGQRPQGPAPQGYFQQGHPPQGYPSQSYPPQRHHPQGQFQ